MSHNDEQLVIVTSDEKCYIFDVAFDTSLEQEFSDDCMRWEKFRNSESGHRMNSKKIELGLEISEVNSEFFLDSCKGIESPFQRGQTFT